VLDDVRRVADDARHEDQIVRHRGIRPRGELVLVADGLHLCWGSWHGPHTTDVELKDILPVVLQANVGSIFASMRIFVNAW
jgi:UDP-3-O-acyl-N-acetylglucosamine deacetylase